MAHNNPPNHNHRSLNELHQLRVTQIHNPKKSINYHLKDCFSLIYCVLAMFLLLIDKRFSTPIIDMTVDKVDTIN